MRPQGQHVSNLEIVFHAILQAERCLGCVRRPVLTATKLMLWSAISGFDAVKSKRDTRTHAPCDHFRPDQDVQILSSDDIRNLTDNRSQSYLAIAQR